MYNSSGQSRWEFSDGSIRIAIAPGTAVATQIDFLLHELGTTEQTAARHLRGCATVTAAARAFSKYFERPHPKFAHNDRRIRNAERDARVIPNATG